MAENKQNDKFNFPPVGRNNPKKPRMNGYWAYILIFAIIVGWQFFFSMPVTPEKTSWQKVKTTMLEKQEVAKLVAISNTGEVDVYLKPDKIENHADLKARGFTAIKWGVSYGPADGEAGMKKTVARPVRPSVEELLTRPERALSIHPLSICSAICEGRVPCRADFAERKSLH